MLALGPQRALAGDDVQVELSARTLVGRAPPQLVVHLEAPVEGLSLELTRSDGVPVRRELRKPKNGSRATFDLPQPPGAMHYDGALVARFPKGPPRRLPLSFDTAVLTPPRLTVADDAVDLAHRTVTLSADRPLASLRLMAFGEDGATLDDRTQPPPATSGPLKLSWSVPEGSSVLKVSIVATDADGFFQQVDLYPWQLELSHEDILFASGSSEVAPEERAKLARPLALLADGLRRYGKVAPVRLFVAGHTDTVGDARANAALSEARALSIARAMREAGVRLPLSYAGLGEQQPLVPTSDETDEPRNRRATYTLAVDPPRGVNWKLLGQGPR